ncbi:MAG: hydroxyacid dehydrogenase [Firmicutes bacterium]|nr:hydroxyacid dehydrogenase [Bacillota bacterium]
MKSKILLSESIHEEGINILRQFGEVQIAADTGEETLVKAVADADALVVRSSQVTGKIIQAGKRLKVIGRHGIGLDNIDLEAASRCKVAVVNTPEANVLSVAEHVIASMLYLCKKLPQSDKALRSGVFNRSGSLPGLVTKLGYTTLELYGKTLGLVGVGKISRRVAEIAGKGFNMNTIGYDAFLPAETIKAAGVEPCSSLEELFKQSDFISLHVPLTPATKDLVDAKLLGLMKPTAYLVNTARGGVVNEEALYTALKNNAIAGAAVDVFATEPPQQDHPFFELDNILVTPHAAAMTDGALLRMALDVAEGVVAVLKGEKPKYLVNPEVWEK